MNLYDTSVALKTMLQQKLLESQFPDSTVPVNFVTPNVFIGYDSAGMAAALYPFIAIEPVGMTKHVGKELVQTFSLFIGSYTEELPDYVAGENAGIQDLLTMTTRVLAALSEVDVIDDKYRVEQNFDALRIVARTHPYYENELVIKLAGDSFQLLPIINNELT